MKSIILATIVGSVLFTGGSALFSVSEPVALILIGAFLIGLARFGKGKILKNRRSGLNRETTRLGRDK